EVLAAEIVPFHADFFAVDVVNDDGTVERVVASHIDAALTEAGRHPEVTEAGWADGIAEVLHRGESVLFPPILRTQTLIPPVAVPEAVAAMGRRLQLDSWGVVPIRARGLSLGALTVGTIRPRRGLRPSDLAAFEELAERTALALERVLLYRQTQSAAASAERNAARLGRAVEAAPAITSSLALPEVAAEAARQAARAMGGLRAVVSLDRPDREPIVASWPPGTGAAGPGAWLDVPIAVPGSPITGSLAVAGPPGHEFESEEEAVLRLLAQTTAAAVGHAELYEAAAASERRLRAVVEASPLAILETDGEGSPLAWNAAAATLFHWSTAATAQTASLSAATVDLLRGCRRQLEHGEAVIDQRAVLSREDGSAVDVVLAAALLGDDRDALLCVISDVTERQLLEREVQQKRRMEALGRLAGGVAHDFNNLLTVIVGYADLLAYRLGEDHPLYRDVDGIRAAGRRASTFTEQLLTISRRRVVQDTVVELNDAIVELESVLRPLVGEDVVLESDLRPDSGRIRIDVGQLEQIVLNLVINARDAMPDGGRIVVQAACGDADPEADGRDWSILTVTDTGVGMDAVTLERCFEPFFTTRDRGKGTGLGLATVYGIVEQAGARISVSSVVGEGTSIRIAFPRLDAPADAVRPAPPVRALEGAGTGQVLLAEDDPDVRSFVRLVLLGAGYSVQAAASGDEALRMARQGETPFDLLVTDVVMPGISGPELAVSLSERLPGLAVLFMSGYVEDDPRARAIQEHPRSRFLPKPFGPDQLLVAVRDVLGSPLDQGSKR
ncbi:MAG TPA: ATP-binding protein, partial [Acidimicrobiales bacterium]